MARILVNGVWYEQVSPGALYENEFESVVVRHAPSLYPDFHVIPFKCRIETEEGEGTKADLALIDKNYRQWWVVEAELAHHSLDGHVLPQVRRLSRGIYDRETASYLRSKNSLLEFARLIEMMKGAQPRVLVVVNTPEPSWVEPLRRYDALLAVFEMFRSRENAYVFRVNGHTPELPAGLISRCRLDPSLPRLLVIESPSGLGIPPAVRLNIYVEEKMTEWERLDSRDRVWLTPVSANPLLRDRFYDLWRREDGALLLREASTQRR